MNESEIKAKIEAVISCEIVEVAGDGYHFEVYVVSDEFEGKRAVARQQMVYAAVQAEIASGELHALSIKTKTKLEHSQSK